MKIYQISSEFVQNYDKLYVFPRGEGYVAIYGDMQLVFDKSEVEEVCQRLWLYDPIFSQLTKEDLLEILEKINMEENKNA